MYLCTSLRSAIGFTESSVLSSIISLYFIKICYLFYRVISAVQYMYLCTSLRSAIGFIESSVLSSIISLYFIKICYLFYRVISAV